MESFFNAFCSKTYAKASNVHSKLSKIQASPIAELDVVSTTTHRSMNTLLKKEANIDQNPQNSMVISGLPLVFSFSRGRKALEKAHQLWETTINDLSQAKHNRTMPKGTNKQDNKSSPCFNQALRNIGFDLSSRSLHKHS